MLLENTVAKYFNKLLHFCIEYNNKTEALLLSSQNYSFGVRIGVEEINWSPQSL